MARSINLTGRIFAVVACSVALYAAVAAWTGWHDLRAQLSAFRPAMLPLLVLCSLGNYVLRFWRWELYLRRLGIRIPLSESATLFFGTFVMVITPGKVGEAFKAGLLWEQHAVPLARGLPVVLAERLFDFLAVLFLACLGLIFWTGPLTGLTAGLLVAGALPVVLIVLRSARVRRALMAQAMRAAWLRRYRPALEGSVDALSLLLSRSTSLYAIVLSVLAWGCECASLRLVAAGLSIDMSALNAVFVYATGTIVGSLTFLPGGLAGTEGTLIWLMAQLGISRGAAVTAALIVRIATLWLAVALGLAVFAARRRVFLRAGILDGNGDEPDRDGGHEAGTGPAATREGGSGQEPPSA